MARGTLPSKLLEYVRNYSLYLLIKISIFLGSGFDKILYYCCFAAVGRLKSNPGSTAVLVPKLGASDSGFESSLASTNCLGFLEIGRS